uniref:Nucleoside-diphosphate kinase n=1 Tax=Strombidinopsis acuminata TaxID=141414 RepID=A0A7S3X5Z4_9SPIT
MQSVLTRRVTSAALRVVPSGRHISFTAQPAEVSRSKVFAGALAGAAAAYLAGTALQGKPASADQGGVYLADLDRRVRELEVAQGAKTSSAFVFIKPHAVTDKVKQLVMERFKSEGIGIVSEGAIKAETIDKDMLIDTHYGAIAARAMKQKPSELVVQKGAQDAFQKAFGLSWDEALQQGLVYNLVDGAAKLGCSMDGLGDKYDTLKKGETLLKFGGGFYCGKVDGIYVINGFYARMRSQFTVPGESIYFYEVQWDPNRVSWADFRGKVLGGTDPKTADAESLRHAIFKNWKDLSLDSEPNTGNNGLHASASPFEALAERANWLGVSIEADYFGKALLSLGIPMGTIKAWCDDPAVLFQGKKQSLFDLLEDLDGRDCLKKSVDIVSGK